MAGNGPPPRPGRVRRNRDERATTVLVFERGAQPPLPMDRDWHPMTEEWWSTWGASPMADHMTAVDWNVLKMTAPLVDKLWNGKLLTEAAKEIRLREESFGASIAARLRLRIQFAEADETGAAEVKSGDDELARRRQRQRASGE